MQCLLTGRDYWYPKAVLSFVVAEFDISARLTELALLTEDAGRSGCVALGCLIQQTCVILGFFQFEYNIVAYLLSMFIFHSFFTLVAPCLTHLYQAPPMLKMSLVG